MLARPALPAPRPHALSRWLLIVAAMVLLMVVVGGITRLTESGLSMTKWEPISGAVPPLDTAQWNAEFAAYQATPEYLEINRGMSLGEFKHIFFWEYLHRLIGRTIGFVFALPFAWFWWRRAIPRGYAPRLIALFALGGFQGTIGWWMVLSGLEDGHTDVSHLRLAAHLLAAMLLLGGLIWTALDLGALAADPAARPARLRPMPSAALAILTVQLFFGALMAGLNAGLIARDWPLMNGRFFPTEELRQAFPHSLFNDPPLVHFVHRWWAWVVLAAMVVLARAARRAGRRRASILIHIAVGTQILLGIRAVMSGVELVVAVLHQVTGALLLAAAVNGAHAIGRRA